MSQFKAGDRVKILSTPHTKGPVLDAVGQTLVVSGGDGRPYYNVDVPDYGGNPFPFLASELEALPPTAQDSLRAEAEKFEEQAYALLDVVTAARLLADSMDKIEEFVS